MKMALVHHILLTGMVLLVMNLLGNGKAYTPIFPLHRAVDVSHTDRLFAQESRSRSPFIVYGVPEEEELEDESRETHKPLVLLEDHPRPVYREHVIRPNSENEPEQRPNFRFPPPRNEIHNPPQHQSSIEYGFQPLHHLKEIRPTTTNVSKSTTEVTSSFSSNRTEEPETTKSEQFIILSTTPNPIESSTFQYEKVEPPTAFEETENKEETQTRIVYSKENTNHRLSEQSLLQQNYPLFQRLSSTSQSENVAKPQIKTVILNLEPNNKQSGYYDQNKKATTFVLTRTLTDSSRKPTYLYRTAFDGRRAPTNSFTFFQSDVTPENEQLQNQDYHQPVDKSTEHQKGFTTGYEFTIGKIDQDSATSDRSLSYNAYSLSSDQLPTHKHESNTPKKSYSQHVSDDSPTYNKDSSDGLSRNAHASSTYDGSTYGERTSTVEESPRYFTSHSTSPTYKSTKRPQATLTTKKDYYNRIQSQETSPRREIYSEIEQQKISLPNPAPAPAPQTIKADRVPGAPSIPGNFGYLSNGTPFGPQNVPGRAGTDYPTYNEIPFTNFDCLERKIPGFYADMEAGCQVFHTCDMDMRRHSFMCPNGTIFNQEFFTCDWWYNVKCDNSPNFYVLNSDLFKDPPKVSEQETQSKKN